MEPDLIKNSTHGQSHNEDEEFGPNFKRLRMTDNVRELQTVLRDKYVLLLTPGPEVIKLFFMLNSTEHEITTDHKTKIPTDKDVSCFKSLRCCIYHAYKC